MEVCEKKGASLPDQTTKQEFPTYHEAYEYAWSQQFSVKERDQYSKDFAEWYVAHGQNSFTIEVAWNYWWTEIAS